MATQERNRQGFWQSLFGRDGRQAAPEEIPEPVMEAPSQEPTPEVEIAPNDPIVAYFASASGVVEIEKLDLDSPVQRYVPGFPEKRSPITVRQVAGHLAGIRHYDTGEFENREHYATLTEGLAIFAADSLLFEPGTQFSYSS